MLWFISRLAGGAGSLFRSGLVPLREPATAAFPRFGDGAAARQGSWQG
jgi:hypothetical protein